MSPETREQEEERWAKAQVPGPDVRKGNHDLVDAWINRDAFFRELRAAAEEARASEREWMEATANMISVGASAGYIMACLDMACLVRARSRMSALPTPPLPAPEPER